MKLTHRIGAKITAVVTCIISGFLALIFAICVILMYEYGFYDIRNSDDSVDEGFLSFVDYGYEDVAGVYNDISYKLDSWQLFYDMNEIKGMLDEYIDDKYKKNSNWYGIRITDLEGNDLYSNVSEGDAILNTDMQSYQKILLGSLQQYLDYYGSYRTLGPDYSIDGSQTEDYYNSLYHYYFQTKGDVADDAQAEQTEAAAETEETRLMTGDISQTEASGEKGQTGSASGEAYGEGNTAVSDEASKSQSSEAETTTQVSDGSGNNKGDSESYPVNETTKAPDGGIYQKGEVQFFNVYKGMFEYTLLKSEYLQKFFMDMTDAINMFGYNTILEMIDSNQAYVYSYDLENDITKDISGKDEIDHISRSSRFVFNNLYSKLTENQRVINIMIYLDRAMIMSNYGRSYKIYTAIYNNRFLIIAGLTVSLLLLISSLVFMLFSCGHSGMDDEIHLNVIDRIPLEIVFAALLIPMLILFNYCLYGAGKISIILSFYVMFLICFALLLSFTARLKAGTVIKNTLIYRFVSFIGKWVGMVINMIPFMWRGLLISGFVLLVNVFIWVFFSRSAFGYELIAVVGVLINLLFFAFIMIYLAGFKKLGGAAKKMSEGDLEYTLDTKEFPKPLREQAVILNSIGDSMEDAVNKQMKSERMKTELITNVSHDIKTPLTSIINYVDLLKKEDIPSEAGRQYLAVIDRQSARLKKLIIDLIEASKASTGNLEVNLEKTDVNELIVQLTGEYDERAEKSNLQLVVNLLDETGYIMADGRHIFRVLDNLLGNACKYSLQGTRIYVDVLRTEGQIAISVKNISSSRLNISADELMERFVRGDSSRNTEGSGLGLSIAQSLTKLQGGEFTLEIDGDLFKAVLLFPEVK